MLAIIFEKIELIVISFTSWLLSGAEDAWTSFTKVSTLLGQQNWMFIILA